MRCCAHGGFALCVLHTAELLLLPSSPLLSLTRSLWQWHSQALHTTPPLVRCYCSTSSRLLMLLHLCMSHKFLRVIE